MNRKSQNQTTKKPITPYITAKRLALREIKDFREIYDYKSLQLCFASMDDNTKDKKYIKAHGGLALDSGLAYFYVGAAGKLVSVNDILEVPNMLKDKRQVFKYRVLSIEASERSSNMASVSFYYKIEAKRLPNDYNAEHYNLKSSRRDSEQFLLSMIKNTLLNDYTNDSYEKYRYLATETDRMLAGKQSARIHDFTKGAYINAITIESKSYGGHGRVRLSDDNIRRVTKKEKIELKVIAQDDLARQTCSLMVDLINSFNNQYAKDDRINENESIEVLEARRVGKESTREAGVNEITYTIQVDVIRNEVFTTPESKNVEDYELFSNVIREK